MGSHFQTSEGKVIHPDEVLLDQRIPKPVIGAVLFDVDDIEGYRNFMRSEKIDPSMIDMVVAHELEHVRVARLFFPYLKLGIVQVPDTRNFIPFQMSWGTSIPRLASAAISMAPRNISDNDVRAISHIGYKSPEEVAERVDAWNSVGRMGIYIPRPNGRTRTMVKSNL